MPLPAVRAVHRRRLVERHINARQGSEDNNRPPPGLLPNKLQDDERFEEPRIGHDVDRLVAAVAQELIDEARAAKDLLPEGDNNYPTDEVRQIEDALHHPLGMFSEHTVEKECEHDRRGKEKDELQDADLHRVPERDADIGVGEEPVEVGETDPGAVKAEKG